MEKSGGTRFRLNRAIAHTGHCSRREADQLILAGRIKVNGKKVDNLSCLVDLKKDTLSLDGHVLAQRRFQYILFNKPKGIITTCKDEAGRRHVLDLLPASFKHLRPVGRLDRDSAGLLLLTNDGELIQSLTHPSKYFPKTYQVTVNGKVSAEALEALANGVQLSEGRTVPAKVQLISNKLSNQADKSCLEIVLYEGKNRQIRRMCGTLGLPVHSLFRVALGALQLKGLAPGAWRALSEKELSSLKQIRSPKENRASNQSNKRKSAR